MSQKDFGIILDLFAAASELRQEEWRPFLLERAGGDVALVDEVIGLLERRCNESDDSLFVDMDRAASKIVDHSAPDTIGSYEVVRQIGEGGMGRVYLALQHEPVRRQVAIKVLKPGMDTDALLRRFDVERQTLARMSSENIARIFDAGRTAAGRSYFVMEYIEGSSITTYCRDHDLELADCLLLFRQVCDAVQHAHGRGVIHRDLKPANVMVTEIDGRAVVKVIDFGIARAIDPEASAGHVTEVGQRVGTPTYMSPEQLGGEDGAVDSAVAGAVNPAVSDDIDTRTDVYSLGVLLYEMLVGSPPFDVEDGSPAARVELRRRIRLVQPIAPSRRRVDFGLEHAPTPRHLIARSLDWIVLCAMAKNRDVRYPSALALGEDVGRFLEQRPVVAGPRPWSYLVGTFLRRHRAAVAGVAAVLAIGATAIGITFNERQAATLVRAEHRQTLMGQARSAVAQLEALHAGGRWPLTQMRRVADGGVASAVAAHDAAAESPSDLTLTREAAVLLGELQTWQREVQAVKRLDRGLSGLRSASAMTSERQQVLALLHVLAGVGIDITSAVDSSELPSALRAGSRLRPHLLEVVQQLRIKAAATRTGELAGHCGALLQRCCDPIERRYYAEDFSHRRHEMPAVLEDLAPWFGPVQAAPAILAMLKCGRDGLAQQLLARLQREQPDSFEVRLAALLVTWDRLVGHHQSKPTSIGQLGQPDRRLIEALAQGLIAVNPERLAGWVYLLRLQAAFDPSNALATSEVALRRFPDEAMLLRYRAQALLELGRSSEAAATLREVVRLEPKFTAAWLMLRDLAPTELEKFELLRSAVENDPFHVDAALDLAAKWLDRGKPKAALTTLAPLIGIDWRNLAVHETAQAAALALGMGDRARLHCLVLASLGKGREAAVIEASHSGGTDPARALVDSLAAVEWVAAEASRGGFAQDPATWRRAEAELDRIEAGVAANELPSECAFLLLQLWQAGGLRPAIKKALEDRARGVEMDAISPAVLAWFERLKGLRDRVRPRPPFSWQAAIAAGRPR